VVSEIAAVVSLIDYFFDPVKIRPEVYALSLPSAPQT
jgi:hypothetical protein